jgi:uncharacterized protein (DUF305 family)
VLRDLIPRTVVLLSVATAIVAVSIALELPQRGGGEAIPTTADRHAAVADAPAVTGEAGFIAAMVAHHQEAVDVAREAAELGERDEVRDLAAATVVEGEAEIDRLRAWWTAWHPDEPPAVHPPMMRRLEGLTPAEVDLVFVTDMIHHHEMAVAMAEELLASGEAVRPEVERRARDLIRVQGEEIANLRDRLDAGSAPQPAHAPNH